jgi:outer membrane protein assembly factor BamB
LQKSDGATPTPSGNLGDNPAMKRALAFVLALAPALLSAQDHWPQFRGPAARGVASSDNIALRWSATENVEWKTDIPGRGWSSPIVWGDRIFITTVINHGETEPIKKGLYFGGNRQDVPTSEHEWKVFCLDLVTGETLWDRTVRKGRPLSAIHLKNSYASETPVTDGTNVFDCFGGHGIYCLDFAGKVVWEHPLPAHKMRFGWGTSASPVLHGGRLYYVSDNDDGSYLLALDKRTGKELFKIDRNEKSNWATPYVWQNEKRTELITPGTAAIRSYDLDGKPLWTLGPMSTITIAMPYAADGLLYVTSGYVGDKIKPVYAIKPGGSGDLSLPEGQASSEFIAWANLGIGPYNPSTLVHEGLLYVLYDRALVSCFDARTGQLHYDKQRLERSAGFTCSPWASGGRIYCLNEDGACYVLRAGKTFEVLQRNTLAEDDLCMSTPATVGDRLLIRADKRLYSIREK